MANLASVKIGLETAIKSALAVSPALTVAWENMDFTPPIDGSAYAEVFLLPATPENPCMGGSFHREIGLVQISLQYPLNGGAGKAYAKAEAVRALFQRGMSFTSGGVTAIIARTPSIGPGLRQGERYMLPIRIPYFSNIGG